MGTPAQQSDLRVADVMSVTQRIDAAVRPVLAADGYDLVSVEHIGASRILRLYIDKESGIGIDDCTQVSHLVSDLLDSEGLSDAIPGSFNLEVSSPGLDRPLVRPKDFCRFVGQRAKLTARRGAVAEASERRNFAGKLLAADDSEAGGIRLEVDGATFEIQYNAIEQARLVPAL